MCDLETICNPGLRERHWDQMGQELGFQAKYIIINNHDIVIS